MTHTTAEGDKILVSSSSLHPIEIVKLDARDTSNVIGSSGNYAFGVSRDKVAGVLRAFADALEKKDGQILLQQVEFRSTAEVDDYSMHYLTVQYAIPLKRKP